MSLALCFCSFSRSWSGGGSGSGLVLGSGSGLGLELGLGLGLRGNPLLLPLLCTQARVEECSLGIIPSRSWACRRGVMATAQSDTQPLRPLHPLHPLRPLQPLQPQHPLQLLYPAALLSVRRAGKKRGDGWTLTPALSR